METYLEESHLLLIIAMDTHVVVLRIEQHGNGLSLNKESIHLHPPHVGSTFELLKARISFKVKETLKPIHDRI